MDKLKVLNIQDDDIVVHFFDTDEVDYEEVKMCHDALVELLGNKKVITIPTYMSIKTMTKDEVREYINILKKELEIE